MKLELNKNFWYAIFLNEGFRKPEFFDGSRKRI